VVLAKCEVIIADAQSLQVLPSGTDRHPEERMILLSKPGIFNDPLELKPHYQTLQDFGASDSSECHKQMKAQIAEMQAQKRPGDAAKRR